MTTNSLRIARYNRIERPNSQNYLRPNGLIVLDIDRTTGHCKWGYSLCHRTDRFSKKVAWEMAIDALEQGICETVGSQPVFYISNLTDPHSMTQVINELPVSLRRTAVRVATTALRRFYLKGIKYDQYR